MAQYMVQVSNVVKTYKIYDKPIDRLKEALFPSKKTYARDFHAIKDISFNIKKGENFGIVGTNGSGKSTLLKIITGVLNPTSGEVKVNGKVSALLELGAGFNMEYTGIENIYLNGTMMGFSKEEIDKKVDPILEFAGIGEFIDQPVKTYSSGMFTRLAFAVAINVEPEILIVDEALSVGDTRFQLKCMNKMKEMIDGGTTVLFVSHDTNAVKRFCTKAIWLNNGVVMGMGEASTIVDNYLDFLKSGEVVSSLSIENKENDLESIPFVPGNCICEVKAFKILTNDDIEVQEFGLDKPITVEIIYDVYDTNIKNPVLGVAIRGMDDDYVCGLNTMIDNIHIPWVYGRNKFKLHYEKGILATGGKYYFFVQIMDETASVNLSLQSFMKEFVINTEYIGEGRYIIPHQWRNQ